MTAPGAAWRVGFATTLLGIGLGRFAYAPLVPGMIAAGWMSPAEAAVAAAANFVGYLLGAVGALLCPLAAARRLVLPMAWATAASLLACSWFGHMVWFSAWRLIAGIGGAWLMIVAVSTCLVRVEPALRPRLSGRIFSGIGVGIIVAAGIGWLAAQLGVTAAWLLMGAAGVGACVVAQHAWAQLHPQSTGSEASPPRLTRWVPILVVAAYGLDAVGFIPHSVFWVDYLVREVGYSDAAGAAQWWLFGLGSTLGPLLAGRLAAAFGAARATACAYAGMAVAIALPLLGSGLGIISASSLLVGGLVPITVALTSATLALIVRPEVHARWWAIATLGFSIGQAGSSSVMAAIYAQTGSYVPLLQASVVALLLAFAMLLGAITLARR